MDPNSPLIEARVIADTIEHLSTQLTPEVIRAARQDKDGRLYLDRIEYALGTIGKAFLGRKHDFMLELVKIGIAWGSDGHCRGRHRSDSTDSQCKRH